MTSEAREIFLGEFSKSYDMPAAVKAAGIKTAEARAFLRADGAREVDRRVARRLAGDMFDRILAEYEKIAFDADEKVTDRIRALDQLRGMMSALSEEGSDGSLTVRVDYV